MTNVEIRMTKSQRECGSRQQQALSGSIGDGLSRTIRVLRFFRHSGFDIRFSHFA
jgi:hypothetical protein